MERLRDSWKVALLDSKKGGYDALAPLAATLGVAFEKGLMLSVLINRTPIKLSLVIDSGSVTGVVITATLEGPPDAKSDGPFLIARPERAVDVTDKQTGLAREVQLGVPDFDRRVYLDSDATELEVKRVLSAETTREALLELLENRVPQVRFTARTIELTVATPLDTERLLRVLEALLILARVSGPRGAREARRGKALPGLGCFSLVLAGGAFAIALSRWGAGFWVPTLTVVVSGTSLMLIARPLVRSLVSGDSGSGERARMVLALLWLSGGLGSAAALLGVNAELGSGEDVDVGRVVSVGRYDDDDHTFATTVQWSNGNTEGLDLQSPQVDDTVTRTWHHGALGFRWGKTVTLSSPSRGW